MMEIVRVLLGTWVLFFVACFPFVSPTTSTSSSSKLSLASILKEIEGLGNTDLELEDSDPIGLAGVLKTSNIYGGGARGRLGMRCPHKSLCYCYSKVLRKWFCCDCLNGPCFPGRVQATAYPGVQVPMESLQVGQLVLAVTPHTGIPKWTEVLAFLDRRPKEIAEYLKLMTKSNQSLELSSNHLTFVATEGKPESDFVAKFAGEVKEGDRIFVVGRNESGPYITSSHVEFVERSLVKGAYVPLTAEGNIVVNGAVASCYASFDHDLSHAFMAPVRFAATLVDLKKSPFMAASLQTYIDVLKWIGHSILPVGRYQADPGETLDVVRKIPHDLSLVDIADSTWKKIFYSSVLSV